MSGPHMTILVSCEAQRLPASAYGEAHSPGAYSIHVHETRASMDAAKQANPDAIVYHFTGTGSQRPRPPGVGQ